VASARCGGRVDTTVLNHPDAQRSATALSAASATQT